VAGRPGRLRQWWLDRPVRANGMIAATAGIPVAVLSAEAAPSVIRAMRDRGVAGYLTKPLNLTELGQLVDCLTAKRGQRAGQAPRTTPAR
jgi:AmiR/NasT family two-component response regulator